MDDAYDAAPPAPPADADAAGDEPEPKRWPDPEPNASAESFGTGIANATDCLLYTSPSPRDRVQSRFPSAG